LKLRCVKFGDVFAVRQIVCAGNPIPGAFVGNMAGKGRSMREEEVRRVIDLLASTEMTVAEIAARMMCSKSAIIVINHKYQVRQYNGLRSSWVKGQAA
jgi:hypothetical protein